MSAPSLVEGRISNYRPRVADAELESRLEASGAVLIDGPRGCGKTQTALRAARSAVRLDHDATARSAGLLEPSLLLNGASPRLIDEWQLVPAVWNQVRSDIDDHPGETGRFILTGSAVPADDVTRHTGVLRITRLRMYPMSLRESGHSTGEVSVSGLFRGVAPSAPDPGMRIGDIAERVSIGGWPSLLQARPETASVTLRDYLDQVSRTDLTNVDGVRRDPGRVQRVLRSLARNTSTAASARSLAADVGGTDGPIDYHTVSDYLGALNRIFVMEDLPAWSPALRSRTVLRSTATRHFVDPSLAVAALGANPERLLRDVELLGLLFESLAIRDLRVFAQAMDANVFHYRDHSGLEADAIVERRDGAWAAFEVKLGPASVDAAAANLLRLAKRIDQRRHGTPVALVVITGWGYAYRRADGIDVVPIGTLGP
jgi:predicted AAA+ superfamily ATPase